MKWSISFLYANKLNNLNAYVYIYVCIIFKQHAQMREAAVHCDQRARSRLHNLPSHNTVGWFDAASGGVWGELGIRTPLGHSDT